MLVGGGGHPLGGFPSGAETYLLSGRGGEAVLEEEATLLAQVFACGASNYSFLVLVTLERGRKREKLSGVLPPGPLAVLSHCAGGVG